MASARASRGVVREPVGGNVLATGAKLSALSVTLAALCYDAWAAYDTMHGDTALEIASAIAWRCQTVAWFWGVLAGHLFWPTFERRAGRRARRLSALCAFGGALALVDYFAVGTMIPAWPVVLGVVMGHALWPHEPRGDLNA